MRVKLVLLASLIAAIVGAGASIAVIFGVFASLKPLSSPSLIVLLTFIVPLAMITWASIFVYRHTARRRKSQAAMTAMLSLLLTLAAFVSAAILSAKFSRVPPEPIPQPRNIG